MIFVAIRENLRNQRKAPHRKGGGVAGERRRRTHVNSSLRDRTKKRSCPATCFMCDGLGITDAKGGFVVAKKKKKKTEQARQAPKSGTFFHFQWVLLVEKENIEKRLQPLKNCRTRWFLIFRGLFFLNQIFLFFFRKACF